MASTLSDSVEQQFKDLIKQSHDFVRAARESDRPLPPSTTAEIAAWVTRCGQLINLLGSHSSEYYQQYGRALRTRHFYRIDRGNYRHLLLIEGAVTALYDDYRRGLMRSLTGALQNEIYADFLDSATHLLDAGRCDAAAVIIGTVLESALIKLAEAMNVQADAAGSPTLAVLNDAMLKAGIYDKLTHNQVQICAGVRNAATEHAGEQASADQVRMMLQFVQMFCARQLG